jgi:hypothetical protein
MMVTEGDDALLQDREAPAMFHHTQQGEIPLKASQNQVGLEYLRKFPSLM